MAASKSTAGSASLRKHPASPGVVSCSICLEAVDSTGERSVAKLKCGHQFHLDCIGSAFNAKGAMQCPNCRQVEQGQWLFASGCFLQQNLAGLSTLDEDSENSAGMQYNSLHLHDERIGQISRRLSQGAHRRSAVSNGESDRPVNSYPHLTSIDRQRQRAVVLMPGERFSWPNQVPVTPGANQTRATQEIRPWNVASVEATRSAHPVVNLSYDSGVFLPNSHSLFPRTHELAHYGGSNLSAPFNTDERQFYEPWMDGDVPSHSLGAGFSNAFRHLTNRGTRDRAVSSVPGPNFRSEASFQMQSIQELGMQGPLANLEQAQSNHFQEIRRGAENQAGSRRRLGAFPSHGSTGASGRWWVQTSGSDFNQNATSHISAAGYALGVNPLHRATNSQGHFGNLFNPVNPWQ